MAQRLEKNEVHSENVRSTVSGPISSLDELTYSLVDVTTRSPSAVGAKAGGISINRPKEKAFSVTKAESWASSLVVGSCQPCGKGQKKMASSRSRASR